MFLAPTAGPIGIQPMGVQAIMINKGAATAIIGDVVCCSWNHTNAVYPPVSTDPQSIANLRLSPFSCVKLAEGDVALTAVGYIGVVIGLGQNLGLIGSEILVQFGGVAVARTTATTSALVMGDVVCLSNVAGEFSNKVGSTAPDTAVGIALEGVAIGATSFINVLLFEGPLDGIPADVT
jgi:hypothetical protein